MKAFIRRIRLAPGCPVAIDVVAEAVSRVRGRQDYHHAAGTDPAPSFL